MNKKALVKILTICVLAITVTPIITLTVQAKMDTRSSPSIMGEDTKLYKFILFKTGTLGDLLSGDTYHFEMKAGKTYFLKTTFKVDAGIFTLSVGGPGGSKAEIGSWDADDPKSARVIQFTFTPSDSGDHSILILAGIASDAGNYNLYVNQDGFVGWWWMLAAGVGALLIIVLVIVVIARASKPKKRKRRR